MNKVICWGTGKQAETAVIQIETANYDIMCFCDSDEKKWDSTFHKYSIIKPSAINEMVDKIDYIIVTTGYLDSVLEVVYEHKIEVGKVRYWDCNKGILCELHEVYERHMYSMDGEDCYLSQEYNNMNGKDIIYVDVGSFHPYYASNTYWAYQRGAHGINIEPNVEKFHLLEMLRKRDININCGIAENEGIMPYYMFDEPSVNSFDYDQVSDKSQIKEIRDIKVRRLDEILKENNIYKIDFMDIDVEGMELSVLKSIDFSVHIEYILLEQRNMTLSQTLESKEYQFLYEKGYEAVSKYGRTVVYKKQ